jgi:hypothetical protein
MKDSSFRLQEAIRKELNRQPTIMTPAQCEQFAASLRAYAEKFSALARCDHDFPERDGCCVVCGRDLEFFRTF